MFRTILPGALVASGLLALALAAGFGLQLPWATPLWPLPDGRLSFIFMAAILAGSALPLLWIGLAGELAALRGYALGFSVMFGGMAATALWLYGTRGQQSLLAFGLLCAVLAVLCVLLLRWSSSVRGVDPRPMPRALRVPFWIEVGVLTLVGIALMLQLPNVLPWPLRPASSVMYGWAFLGLALYFGYALVAGTWQHTCGQLLGFLAYDLVLIVPFVRQFTGVKPEHLLGLVVATAIVISSAALAGYYLFVNPTTRMWHARPSTAHPEPATPLALSKAWSREA